MNPIEIISEYYPSNSSAFTILIVHSSLVAQKAQAVARRLSSLHPDMDFIYEAAMLHDIGIRATDTPELGCHGVLPYICHGYMGRSMMEERGLPRHGLVCERHVGVGITAEDIRTGNLPIPVRDMTPQSLEEQIVCYADKFFSKNGQGQTVQEKTVEAITAGLRRYGQDKADRFLSWHRRFTCFSGGDVSG
jgi:uncharacterized protein